MENLTYELKELATLIKRYKKISQVNQLVLSKLYREAILEHKQIINKGYTLTYKTAGNNTTTIDSHILHIDKIFIAQKLELGDDNNS